MRIVKTGAVMVLCALFFMTVAIAAEKPVLKGDDHQYVGVAKCKTCHKSAKKGNQYGIWLESKHAKAYETLGSEKAKEVGGAKDVADPQNDIKCTKCHVAGAGSENVGPKYDVAEGVTCEACHGAGADYRKSKTMKEIRAGTLDGATVGLIKPDEKRCRTCHNEESPTFSGFDYAEYYKKIAHEYPK